MCLLATGIVAGAFVFVASDYARLQILRASGALHLQEALHERERLAQLNQHLQEELHNLKTSHTKVLSYKSSLREKLNSLASVLETASSLGLETNQ